MSESTTARRVLALAAQQIEWRITYLHASSGHHSSAPVLCSDMNQRTQGTVGAANYSHATGLRTRLSTFSTKRRIDAQSERPADRGFGDEGEQNQHAIAERNGR